MELKKFLKPDWKKFVLFIAIIFIERIINTFMLGYYLIYGVQLQSIIVFTPFNILNRVIVPILVTPDKGPIIQLIFNTSIIGLSQLLNVLWQYFLACAVIFVFNRFKARKPKKKRR